jgi:hypothetical protein
VPVSSFICMPPILSDSVKNDVVAMIFFPVALPG